MLAFPKPGPVRLADKVVNECRASNEHVLGLDKTNRWLVENGVTDAILVACVPVEFKEARP